MDLKDGEIEAVVGVVLVRGEGVVFVEGKLEVAIATAAAAIVFA